MTDPCDRLHAYVDGELDADETAAFEAHLASCDACNAELPRLLALMSALDAAAAHRAAMPSGTQRLTVLPGGLEDAASAPRERPPAEHGSRRADPRRRPRWIAAGALAVFAAAAVIALVLLRRPAPAPVVSSLAGDLGPARTMEARLSYAGAEAWRRRDVARGAQGHENISMTRMAELERSHDVHGLGVAALLNGELERATKSLRQAPSSPAVDSDLAALELLDGRPEALARALEDVDRALVAAPNHGPALWNRALVLAGMNLPLAAARELDRVVALAEPGWADEARTRAAAMRSEVLQRRTRWDQAVKARQQLLEDGTAIPANLLAITGYMTIALYDAVRAAPSRSRVEALLPMAQALDTAYRSNHLTAYVRQIAASDFAVRAPLAETYRQLSEHQTLPVPAVEAYLKRLEQTRTDDLWMGAMVRVKHVAAHLADYQRRAAATGSPWFEIIAEQEVANVELARGDTAAAEHRLRDALAFANREHLTYRALLLEDALVSLYRGARDLGRANREAEAVYRQTTAAGESVLEMNALLELAAINVARYAHGLARAYLAEALERAQTNPEIGPNPLDADHDCAAQRFAYESLADTSLMLDEPDRARGEIARAPTCRDGATLLSALIKAGLYRVSHREDDAVSARASFAAQRARAGLSTPDQALLAHLEGSLLIDTDRAGARRLLREAITKAGHGPETNSVKARAYSYSLLALDAGRAGEFADVLGLLAETLEVARPERCAIAIAVEGQRSVVAFADAQGQTGGAYGTARPSGKLAPSTLVPPSIVERVRACERVVVLASAPVLGAARLLPANVAWSYRLRGDRAASPPPAAGQRLVVSAPEAPADLNLPPLAPIAVAPDEAGVQMLRGSEATPSRVLLAMRDAAVVEFHSHGVIANDVSEASYLVLSPELDGQYAMTAGDVARVQLTAAPLVILGACHAAASSRALEGGMGLAEAFLRSGARAVIASPDAVQDLGAYDFFAAVRQRVAQGSAAASAVRDERMRKLTGSADDTWVTGIVVFE